MAQVLQPLATAREAASRHAWRTAYDSFSASEGAQLTAEDLEWFADASWWTGRLDEAIRLRERAYAAYSTAGDTLGSARLALTLSWDHSGRGSFAVAGGWFATAERLLADVPDAREHGFLALTQGVNALYAEGRIDDSITAFERAYELGKRYGDRDTQALALSGRGRALIKRGLIDDGLALLDEATAAAVCGELRPYATGLVYCMTISSCHDLGDYRRAAEWTEAANSWCDSLDVSGFPGACRIHRAEIMRLRGDLEGAERQAIAACNELHDYERNITAGGYYELGEIRRRRGDFAAADEAYRTAKELGREPQPGLALLRLAEGKIDGAVAAISRTLEDVDQPLVRLRHLPALVEIAVAASDLRTARAAVDELDRIVESYKIGARRAIAFDATLHLAEGRIRLADGDPADAVESLKRARDEWREVGAPYETAQAQVLLGLAFRRAGDEHAAVDELDAAQSTFARLGAKLDEERANELLGRQEARRTFVFTDIVDSTRLLDTLGSDKWRRLLARHDELLRERILEQGGEVIKHTGDGFFAAFENPKAAIDAAVAIQRALDAEIVAPDVRIGVHTGGAFHKGGDASDYGGQGVHVAARIGAAAGAGEVLVSRDTLDGIGAAFRVSEPHAAELAGFDKPVDVVSIDWR